MAVFLGRPTFAEEATFSQWVVEIEARNPSAVSLLLEEIDVLETRGEGGALLALVSSRELEELSTQGVEWRIDWQRTEALNRTIEPLPDQGGGIPGFPCYRTVEETFADLSQLALDHPDLATWVDIGDSWEKVSGGPGGYDIFDLVITNSVSKVDKAPFFLLAAIHARELVPAELATLFAEQLVLGYGVDPDITWILDHSEIHIVAQGNPDGRKRAETGLLWRKNIDNDYCSDSNLRGIDLNRNSSFRWATVGSSSSECSNTFHGPGPASEPETQAFETLMAQIFEDQRGPEDDDAAPLDATGLFVSLHSFGEWVVFPWDGLTAEAPNSTELQTLGRKFGFFNGHRICQTSDCLGPAAGGTSGVSYGEYGVATYTFEVGTWFFEECPVFASDVLPKNLPALFYAAKAARRPYQEPSGPDAVDLLLAETSVPQGEEVVLTATVDDTRYDSGGFGTEPTQMISSASYSVDSPPWLATEVHSLAPVDGAFDAAAEDVSGVVDTSTLALGQHLIYVFATDAAGSRGVPSAIFLEVTEPSLTEVFSDGFESGDSSFWTSTVGG
ncbi:MAG: peptidase M14 [Deltaproteobacteria bacterium]|nr:peptidase M14 [Deltaproteobacteria bacterium]